MPKPLSETKEEIINKVKQYYLDAFKKEFVPGKSIVPCSGKLFDEKELIAATNAILDGWWTDGPYAGQFEKMICDYVGVEHSCFVNSGSSANLLALTALMSIKMGEKRIKKGDEVITTACNFPTTVNPILQNSLIPVFCDVELGTYNINIEELRNAVSDKTRCVFLAHTLGNPFDVKKVRDVCDEHGLFLIEDCCDALGSMYDGKKVGNFGDIATLSFYPAHHITSIEGGMVLSNNKLIMDIVRSLRDWGRDCKCPTGKDNICGKRFDMEMGELPKGYDHKYIYSGIGYNLKSTDINAAIGIEQLKKIEEFNGVRERNFKRLYEGFRQFEDLFILPKENGKPSWFGFVVTLRDNCNFTRRELLKYLDEKKIGSRLMFGGNITKQPYFIDNDIEYRKVGSLKNTDIVMDNSFWIGNNQLLNDAEIDYIIDSIKEFVSR
jgi:CDP-6-deoxy-D-xylo-4-hexulose-3-dehydrase